MRTISTRARKLFSLLTISALCLFTVACGDSNDLDEFVVNNINNNAGFVGQYSGASTLNNQNSTLTLATSNNGQAAGSLQVAAVTPQTTFPVGTYPVTGTFNGSTGAFTVTGSIPNVGPFTITGVLPTGSNQGSYTLSIGNETFAGVIQNSSLGTPNPPTNTGGGTSALIQGGSLTNFVFNPDGSYNGDNPPVDAQSTISGAVGDGVDGTESATFVLSEIVLQGQTAFTTTFTVSIVAPQGQDLVTGQTYQLASDANSNGAIIALSSSEGINVTEGWSLVQATTGSAVITARDANSITINFQFNNVGPNSEIAENPAQGTFSTSGTITGNFANVAQ